MTHDNIESTAEVDLDVGPFDAEHPPPLDFETWADISATLLQRDTPEQLDILGRRDLDVELWDACNIFWLQELGAQIARGNDKLAARYGTRCADELRTRQPRGAPPREPPATDDLDGTAFMTALHDETALPFASPIPSGSLPFDTPKDDTQERPSPDPSDALHPDIGETQEVSALPSIDLPFKKRD